MPVARVEWPLKASRSLAPDGAFRALGDCAKVSDAGQAQGDFMANIVSEANLKFLAILVTVMLGLGGIVFNFYEMQQSMALEARRPFLEKQLELCFEASNATSTYATTADADLRRKSIDRFWALYWGQLGIVEDDQVEAAMVNYKKALGSAGSEPVPAALKRAALGVAHACRDLILESWDVDIPDLKDRN